MPPLEGPVAFAFVPGKSFINLDERFDRDFSGAPDAARTAVAVNHHHVLANLGQRFLAFDEVAKETGGGALDACEHEPRKFIGHRRTVAEGDDIVAVMINACSLPVSLPERIGSGCFGHRSHLPRRIPLFWEQVRALPDESEAATYARICRSPKVRQGSQQRGLRIQVGQIALGKA
jgi:hypothetical protein